MKNKYKLKSAAENYASKFRGKKYTNLPKDIKDPMYFCAKVDFEEGALWLLNEIRKISEKYSRNFLDDINSLFPPFLR